MLILVTVFGLIFALMGLSDYLPARKARRYGAVTLGILEDVQLRKKGSTNWLPICIAYVAFQDAEGQRHRMRYQPLDGRRLAPLIGQPPVEVTVRYLERDPHTFAVDEVASGHRISALFTTVGLGMAVLSIAILLALR